MTGNSSSSPAVGANLDKFFEDVEAIKDELKEVERIHHRLHKSNEASKTLHTTFAVRAYKDSDVTTALKKAKLIKLHLESLDRANAANCSILGAALAPPPTAPAPPSTPMKNSPSFSAKLSPRLQDDSLAMLRWGCWPWLWLEGQEGLWWAWEMFRSMRESREDGEKSGGGGSGEGSDGGEEVGEEEVEEEGQR